MDKSIVMQLQADDVNRMILVPGIVINSARTRPKAVSVTLRCKGCSHERVVDISSGFASVPIPNYCLASYVALLTACFSSLTSKVFLQTTTKR
jgi:DNA replicative helicase MCM subunit Mcm2 (Cdc46/Mcm family)